MREGPGPRTSGGAEAAPPARVLVVACGDAAGPAARASAATLSAAGMEVSTSSSAILAARLAAGGGFEAAVCVLEGQPGAGAADVPWPASLPGETPVVAVGVPEGAAARDLLLKGAFLTVARAGDEQELLRAARRASRMGRELARAARYHARPSDLRRLLGAGAAMKEAVRLIPRAAETLAPVLLVGEPGAGKHLAARTIHELMRPGRTGPYVRAAVPAFHPGRLHEDLFGTALRPGLLERAAGGTLFLDGVGGLPHDLQARLLDLLHSGPGSPAQRADASGEFAGDVRLAFGSSLEPDEEVERGRLREDLYYRLKVIPIRLPPLRHRPEDLPVLAVAMIDRHAAAAGRTILGPAPATLAAMRRHDWPGNLRELEDRIAAAVPRSRGPALAPSDLGDLAGPAGRGPEEGRGAAGEALRVEEAGGSPGALTVALALDATLSMAELGERAAHAIEIEAIRHALGATGGNVTHAAKLLQVSRIHLQKRMKLYGLRESL